MERAAADSVAERLGGCAIAVSVEPPVVTLAAAGDLAALSFVSAACRALDGALPSPAVAHRRVEVRASSALARVVELLTRAGVVPADASAGLAVDFAGDRGRDGRRTLVTGARTTDRARGSCTTHADRP